MQPCRQQGEKDSGQIENSAEFMGRNAVRFFLAQYRCVFYLDDSCLNQKVDGFFKAGP